MNPQEPKRILVPVDFSPQSRRAVDFATVLARHFGAEVQLLHCPSRPAAPAMSLDMPLSLETFAGSDDSRIMDTYLADLEIEGIDGYGRLEEGNPVDAILRAADEGDFDLIVMGTHGRTGLAHLFYGSVAEKVVRRANCPVVTVHADDHEFATELDRDARTEPRSEPAQSQ